MRAAQPAPLTLLAAALALLALAGALFALYIHPAYAQDGSPPAKPTGLYATASHDQVILTWDDPGDDSITGYVILRRVRVNNTGGDFSELVANTGSAAATYTDDTVAANTTYTYRIKAINGAGTSERSRWFHIEIPAPPVPDKPRGLEATATHDTVTLTWDDPGDDSITGYVILRRVRVNDTGGEFSVLAADTGSAATTYTDDTVAASTTYTYRIKAINEHGVSERSRWYHIDTPAAPEPEPDPADLAPSGLTAVLTDGQVALSWDAPVDDAGSVTGYEILRGQGEGDPATLAADTGSAATTYTDATATQASESYTYRVKALRGQEQSQASGEAVVVLPPGSPTGVLSAATHDSVLLSWNDPQDDTITGYRVLRADTVDGVHGEFVAIASDTGSTDTSYTDDTVEPERSYAYRVQAVSPQGLSGPPPDLPVDTPAAPAPLTLEPTPAEPQSPSGLAAEVVDGQVVLSWDAPAEDAASVTGYEVLRAEGAGELAVLVVDTGNTATAYTDATATSASGSYTYRVKALRSQEQSQVSNEAVLLLPPAKPRSLTTEVIAHDSVTLTWRDPQDDSITGYAILRRDKQIHEEGTFDRVASDTGSAETTYTDDTVEPNKQYVYRIKAINAAGPSEISSWVRAYTPEAPAASQRRSVYIDAHNAGVHDLEEFRRRTDSSNPNGAADEDGDEGKGGKSVGAQQGKAITPRATVNICNRTPEVEAALLESIGGGVICSAVTDAQLAQVNRLLVEGYSRASIVPSDFAGLTGLQELQISNSQQLTSVPANAFRELSGLTNFNELELSSNQIETIDSDAFDGLTFAGKGYLELKSNQIESLLPGTFNDVTGVKRLDLTNNRITGNLIAGLAEGLTELEDLVLGYNHIKVLLEGSFEDLAALKRLYIHNNGLTVLEANTFSGLGALEHLNMTDNALRELPAGIFDYSTGLKTLYLGGNSLTTLDKNTFSGLTSVWWLRLQDNNLTNLDKDIFDGLSGLQYLYLWGNKLTELDKDIFDGPSGLQFLYLNDNSLTELDQDVFNGLSGLYHLSLHGNKLADLPEGIFEDLQSLETLNLHHNSLTTLPSDIFEPLDNLYDLALSDNDFGSLPANVFAGLDYLGGVVKVKV